MEVVEKKKFNRKEWYNNYMKKRYNENKITCEYCKKEVSKVYYDKHLNNKSHQILINFLK